MSMGSVIRRSAIRFPNKDALRLDKTKMTYKELNERVNCLANSLLRKGLVKGDRLAVLLHNSIECYEIYYACAKSGGIYVPINNLLKQTELKQIVEYIEPKFLFYDSEFEAVIEALKKDIFSVDDYVSVSTKDTRKLSTIHYEKFLEQGESTEPDAQIADDDIMSIFLTSGTTGLPKGAKRTHRHVYIATLVSALEFNLSYHDRVLIPFPFYHVSWEDNMRHILMGNTIVIRKESNFIPSDVLRILSEDQITTCQFVPTMINALLQEKNMEQYDLTHLRLISYAASPMPVELLKRAMEKFHCEFIQLYGQTETAPIATTLRPEDHVLEGSKSQMARLASAGRPVVNYEVRIVDREGRDLPVGDIGEIIVRSESMTVGYWNLPEETAKTIKNGWLHTGDFGKFDSDGYVYIMDRKNDLIISGGKNIYPREIEELLYQHEAVLECAVIGVPDDYWGESVKALVVLKEGKQASEDEIIRFCKDHLASYKKPRTVEFKKALPKSPTGKILKRIIRDDYWKGQDRRI